MAKRGIHKPTSGIVSLEFASIQNAVYILSQGRDGVIYVWKLDVEGLLSSDPVGVLEVGTYNFCRMGVLVQEPSRALVAACGRDPSVVSIWDVLGSSQLVQLIPSVSSKWGMCMALVLSEHSDSRSRDQSAALRFACWAGYESGIMVLWDCDPEPSVLSDHQMLPEAIMSLSVDSNLTGGVCGGPESVVALFSYEAGFSITNRVELPKAGVSDIVLRTDDKIFVTAGWDGRIRVFRYMSTQKETSSKRLTSSKAPGCLVTVLVYHQAGVNVVLFRKKDNLLVSGSKDRTVAVWRAFETGTHSEAPTCQDV
eukprot:jgi/Botrbrau1/16432/Bobra.0142s0031.2